MLVEGVRFDRLRMFSIFIFNLNPEDLFNKKETSTDLNKSDLRGFLIVNSEN